MIAKKIDLFEYFVLFREYRSPLSDLYIKRNQNTIIFGAYDDNDENIGLLLIRCFEDTSKIQYIKAFNDDIEIYKVLIDCALIELRDKVKTLEWWIVDGAEKFDIEKKCAEELKFACYNTLNIFRHTSVDKDKALAFVEKNRNISNWHIKRGYEIKSFEELSKEQLDYMSNDPDGQFESSLHIDEYINNEDMNLCKDKSFVCLKNGRIIAFASVSLASKGNYIYDSTCVAKDYKMSGVFVPVNNAVFNAVFNSDYDTLMFAVYDTNTEMLPVFRKWLMPLITSSTKQFNYIRPIDIPENKEWEDYRKKYEEKVLSKIGKD